MDSFDKKKDSLVGSKGEEVGGLLIQKKSDETTRFKKPKVSLLGLDSLAREKRKHSTNEDHHNIENSKRYKIDKTSDGGNIRISYGSSRVEKHYR